MTSAVRVLVADDEISVRSALRRLLKEEPGIELVGEAANLGELVRQALAKEPDLILLDWELSGLPSARAFYNGDTVQWTRAERKRNVVLVSLHNMYSHPQIIALSSRPEVRESALRAGVDAFVDKGNPPLRLIGEIRDSFLSE